MQISKVFVLVAEQASQVVEIGKRLVWKVSSFGAEIGALAASILNHDTLLMCALVSP